MSYISRNVVALWAKFNSVLKVKVQLKLSRYRHAGNKGESRNSSYSFLTSALDEVSVQHHATAALYPRGKEPRYALDRRLGGRQSQSGYRG
jgi:hypothetical protein